MLLLRMRTGSHLYDVARPDSDSDWLEVHDRLPGPRQSRQTIAGDLDCVQMGLSTFMAQADAGVPQALEAMFAPAAWPETDMLAALRRAFWPSTARAANTYRRTIAAFDRLEPTPKRRRHAVRLAHNLDELIARGRFDPRDTRWIGALPADLRWATDPVPHIGKS